MVQRNVAKAATAEHEPGDAVHRPGPHPQDLQRSDTAVRSGVARRGRSARRVALALATCAAAATGSLTASPAAHAATGSAHVSPAVSTTTLPGNQFRAMAVDPVTGRVFAALADTNTVAVLDASGNILSTITGEAGADGLVVHGGGVFVANGNAGTIDEFDTSTLLKVKTVATGLVQPADVVYTAGALWTESNGLLARVNVTTGQVTTWPNVSLGALAADPGNTNEIVTYAPQQSPVALGLIDVSTATPTLVVSRLDGSTVPVISNVRDVAVSPDGAHTVPAGGAPYEFIDFNTATMQRSGVIYPANPYPDAVAMTAGGGGLFAGGMNGLYAPDVVVYGLGNPADQVASYDFGNTSETTLPHGLAFTPDGAHLFVVTGGIAGNDEFHVMTLSNTPPPPNPTPKLSGSPGAAMGFGNTRLGNLGGPQTITLTNTGTATAVVEGIQVGGPDPLDFIGVSDCASSTGPVQLVPGATCQVTMGFVPSQAGPRSATLQFVDNETQALVVTLTGNGTEGYYEAGADGHVYPFGDALGYGDPSHLGLASPIVSMSATPDGNGYWLLGTDGGIFSYGDAAFYGSTGAIHLNQPVVGMAPTPDGQGYWLVARDGGIFAFGDAGFYGSTGGIQLNQPVVGMTPTPDGAGYWLVASDGGIFAFGDAPFYGSTGAIHLNQPIVGMAPTPDGGGYWLVARDGGIFAFGDAGFYGSTGAMHLTRPVVGMAASPTGLGYWLVASDGGIFAFGDSPYLGSTGGSGVSDIVTLAPSTSPTLQALLGIRARALERIAHATPASGGWYRISG